MNRPDRRPTMTEVLKFIHAARENEEADFEISYERAQIEETISGEKGGRQVENSRNMRDRSMFLN